jgi:hypothetical protein
MAIDVIPIPDELLERAANERGSRSTEAKVLAELRLDRALDRQWFAFQCGSLWFVGSAPDARTERAMIEVAVEVEKQQCG